MSNSRDDIPNLTPREKVRAILFDRWNIDSVAGDPNDETILDTLDEIEAAYRPYGKQD